MKGKEVQKRVNWFTLNEWLFAANRSPSQGGFCDGSNAVRFKTYERGSNLFMVHLGDHQRPTSATKIGSGVSATISIYPTATAKLHRISKIGEFSASSLSFLWLMFADPPFSNTNQQKIRIFLTFEIVCSRAKGGVHVIYVFIHTYKHT